MDAVDQVLAQRARRQSGSPQWASLGAAALLHAGMVVVALLLPRFEKPPEPLQFVPVTVMPAQALGVERPLARPAHPTPEPAPAPAAPEPPAAKPTPPKAAKPAPEEREPPVDERPALPETKPKPERPEKPGKGEEKTGRKPLPPAPSQGHAGPGGVAAVGKGEELGKRGSATGSPLGTSGLGSQIAGVEDPDFQYGYYLDRLLQLIDANWTRPNMASGVRAVLHFRIRKDGGMDELRIEESSGYNSFDLAALRAVQNAAPFPALPASYRHDSLGVSLIVR
ncbi:MAG TPA: TonB family protein [Thermoanaerobaculia bacterium]|nr:TonB family protein [Thermoanaerobaculia bacterium]